MTLSKSSWASLAISPSPWQICATRSALAFRRNLSSQGIAVGRCPGRTARGPSESRIHPGSFFMTPGFDSGTISLRAISAQFPSVASPPISPRSISVVPIPWRCSESAQHTPIIPPPITVTSDKILAPDSLKGYSTPSTIRKSRITPPSSASNAFW